MTLIERLRDNEAYVDACDEAANELDRLTKLNAELLNYARHSPLCCNGRQATVIGGDDDIDCDCGLAQLLEKMK